MSKCEVCEFDCRFAQPTGPRPASTMAIGEKPGRQEAYTGRVFVGDAGEEVNKLYFPLAGLDRDDVYVSNCVKCWLGGNNNKPTPKQVEGCGRHWLPDEVAECRPQVIILMGSTACSLVPKIELDKDHGIPVWVEVEEHRGILGEWEGWVWPSYHPAAALHETRMMTPLLEDFKRLGLWLAGKWTPPTVADEEVDYRVLESKREILDVIYDPVPSYGWLPVDTENDGREPWSLQFSPRPGTAYLVRAARKDLVGYFGRQLKDGFDGDVILHFAVHDLDVLEAMGIKPTRFRDTMQEAYQQGNLPQGLKALAWRLMGVRMESWEDVVMPHSRQKAVRWLMEKWDAASDDRERVEKQLKTKVRVTRRPTGKERALKRIISHSHKAEYDLWEKAREAGVGEGMPIPSIAHVPIEQAVRYACQDADMTGRVGRELERRRKELVGGEWSIPAEDHDQ